MPENIASGRLVRVLAPWSLAFPGLCRDYPANRHPPAALRLFVAAVREWAANPPVQLPGRNDS